MKVAGFNLLVLGLCLFFSVLIFGPAAVASAMKKSSKQTMIFWLVGFAASAVLIGVGLWLTNK